MRLPLRPSLAFLLEPPVNVDSHLPLRPSVETGLDPPLEPPLNLHLSLPLGFCLSHSDSDSSLLWSSRDSTMLNNLNKKGPQNFDKLLNALWRVCYGAAVVTRDLPPPVTICLKSCFRQVDCVNTLTLEWLLKRDRLPNRMGCTKLSAC